MSHIEFDRFFGSRQCDSFAVIHLVNRQDLNHVIKKSSLDLSFYFLHWLSSQHVAPSSIRTIFLLETTTFYTLDSIDI
jgi:hypothetical protein